MRILYGVVGEGMGHATRSRVLLEELSKEHEVHIVVSGRAKDYLAKRFQNVHGIWGFTIAYEGNSVKKWQTVLQNVTGAVKGWPQNIRQYFELVEEFKPDVVVSDFESFSYLFARNHRLPVISVDNMQVINRCKHEPGLLAGWEDSFEGTRAIVKAKLPGAFHYVVTSFFYPPTRKERTTLAPSILRPEILAAKSEPGEHLLVYQPAHAVANGYFVGAINRVGHEQPWNIGEFYGQSYFCDPRGQIIAEAPRDTDHLVVADLDLEMIRQVRNTWQFFRDRRPETYDAIVAD